MIRFSLDGVKHEFDDNRMMNTEAIQIRRKSEEAWSLTEWFEALGKGDPEALTLLVWLTRRREGETDLAVSAVEFDLVELALGLESDEESDVESDPTDSTTKPEPI